jgi:uncharacterized protein YraI
MINRRIGITAAAGTLVAAGLMAAAAPSAYAAASESCKAKVTSSDGVNIRSKPSTSGNFITAIPYGDVAQINTQVYDGSGYTWWAVEWGGHGGYSITEAFGTPYDCQPA